MSTESKNLGKHAIPISSSVPPVLNHCLFNRLPIPRPAGGPFPKGRGSTIRTKRYLNSAVLSFMTRRTTTLNQTT